MSALRKSDVRTEKDLREYLKGWSKFERDVYLATFKIPEGRVSTYSRVARAIGRPKAQRAVANALHKNPLYPIVPCHRVVKSDGGFGGERRAAAARRRHVEREGVPTKDDRVVLTGKILY
ncbi:MAG: MGMT family protein [Methanobacteriota archaeon]|nr:MAG: MGMT family protein [Euryarchaeota archaeon]